MTAQLCPRQCCSACCTCAVPASFVVAELVHAGLAGEALGLYRQILASHPTAAAVDPMDLGSIAGELARRGLLPAIGRPGVSACCGTSDGARHLGCRPGSRAANQQRRAEAGEGA